MKIVTIIGARPQFIKAALAAKKIHIKVAHIEAGLRAFKNTTLLGYELIWNNLTFNTQCFVKLEKRHIQSKVEALKEYKSQGFRDYLSEDFNNPKLTL